MFFEGGDVDVLFGVDAELAGGVDERGDVVGIETVGGGTPTAWRAAW